MRVLFVMDRRVNAGSIQAVASYVSAGDECGHTIALHGRPDPRFPGVRFATDPERFDQVVFIVESSLSWMSGLRLPRILGSTPRSRRAILDADGMYNPVISVDGGDRNHAGEQERGAWLAHYRQLADRVFQPTLEEGAGDASPLPFYGYDTTVRPRLRGSSPKPFDILYVGHNWWRGRELEALLPALEGIRARIGRVCFVGSWWDAPPAAAVDLGLEDAFVPEGERFRRLGIEVRPPVPFSEVVRAMSAGRVNLMTQRPLLRRLRFLTSKYFEVFCADTIPLVMLDPDHAESVYGPAGRELSLIDGVAERLLDVLGSPERYGEAVEEVRRHLTDHHSYLRRVEQLVRALGVGSAARTTAGCA